MARRLSLLLLFTFVLIAHVAAGPDEAGMLAKESARIKRRKELQSSFNSAERLVAEKIEAFALQPVRDWEGAVEDLVGEPALVLANPLRYYILDDDWEVQAFACFLVGRAGLVDLLPELEQAFDDARYPIIRRTAVEAANTFARGARPAAAHPLLRKGIVDEEPGVRLLAVEGLE